MSQQYTANSVQETHTIAENLAQEFFDKGGLILLSGNLGAGKTTFTQGFIKSFGIIQNITSPTFLLVKQYQIPHTERWIFHLDLYRLAEPIDLHSTGIQEILDSADDNIVLIEWSEKIKSQLANKTYYEVNLKKNADDNRSISVLKNNL